MLDAGEFARADQLLEKALDLPKDERGAYLKDECGSDEALLARVSELVRLAESDGDVLKPGGALEGVAPLHGRFTLQPGTLLGRYEVKELLGTGGMGSVYRALDPTLGREVAIKALAPTFRGDPSSLKRFEREARLLASVSHPNVASVFGFEVLGGSPYLILEKIEGETLSQRLRRGPLAVADTVAIGVQIADGLAEAHAKGIVHRDLKPSNVMLTAGGRVKLVDFGLAKSASKSGATTHVTTVGTVLGTAPYMSPEQVQGEDVDTRTDVWSFGCLVYEMLAGKPAFSGGSVTEVLASVLRDEPDWGALSPALPPPLLRLVRRCLAKEPKERLQHVGDARLELLDAGRGEHSVLSPAAAHHGPGAGAVVLAAAGAALVGLLAGLLLRTNTRPPEPRFSKLTFQRGYVREARFLPDGTSILYSASWNGEPLRIYQMKPGGPDAAPLPLPSANLLAVSPSSELAVALACETTHNGVCRGTLATASLAGGAPHEVAENVQDADYAAGGSSLAIVRDVAGGARLELPPGRVLRETGGHFSSPRVSPAQDAIALFEHPDRGDDRGHVALVDFHGKTRRLTKDWTSVRGLAWSKDGKEIWFTGADAGSARALWAVTLGGELRLLHRGPSDLTVLDVGKDGRLLLAENEQRWGALGSLRGAAERELSWLDRSVVSGIAPDGASILITEQSDSVGPDYASALRGLDGAPPIPVGSGWATSINLEKTRVLTRLPSPGAPLSIVTLPSGDVKTIASPALQCQRADFFPDGKRILVFANEPGHRLRLWVVDSETARWTPISEEGQIQSAVALSPDGRSVAGWGADHRLMLFPVGGGAPTPVAGAVLADAPLAFVDGGRALVVSTPQRTPRRLFRIDLATGTRTPWKELMPRDQAGAFDIINAFVAPEGGSYAYTYGRWLSDLYVVNGLR